MSFFNAASAVKVQVGLYLATWNETQHHISFSRIANRSCNCVRVAAEVSEARISKSGNMKLKLSADRNPTRRKQENSFVWGFWGTDPLNQHDDS